MCWLFDHLLPIGGDPNGPILEGWTLLSALAAQTRRRRPTGDPRHGVRPPQLRRALSALGGRSARCGGAQRAASHCSNSVATIRSP